MSASIVNILNEMATSLGRSAVIEACAKFSSSSSSTPEAVLIKKVKKERGPSSWNLEVEKVLEDMRASVTGDEKVTYKMAMAEAGRRRRANDPEAQAKYEETAKAKASAKAARGDAVGAEVVAEAPKKKAGRPAKA